MQQLVTPPAQSETHEGATICDDLTVVAEVRVQVVQLLLVLLRRRSLKRVGHEASVGSLGDKGMPRSHNLKAHKAEGSEQSGSVITVLVEANEDMVSMQLLLSKLEKNCKAVFAPLWQSSAWDLDVEAATAQHCSPVDVFGICEPGLDIENSRLVIRR